MAAIDYGQKGREVDDRRGRLHDPVEFLNAIRSGEDERQALVAARVVLEIGTDVQCRERGW